MATMPSVYISSDSPPLQWIRDTALATLGQQPPAASLAEARRSLLAAGALHELSWAPLGNDGRPDPARRITVVATDPWALTATANSELPIPAAVAVTAYQVGLSAAVDRSPEPRAASTSPATSATSSATPPPSAADYPPLIWRLRELANSIAVLDPLMDHRPDLLTAYNALREQAAQHYWPAGLAVHTTGLVRDAHPDLVADVLHEATETGQLAADTRLMNLAALDDAELAAAMPQHSRDQLAAVDQLAGAGAAQWWATVELGDFASTVALAEQWRHLSPTAQQAHDRIAARLAEAHSIQLAAILQHPALGYVDADTVAALTPRLERARLAALVVTAESAEPSGPVPGRSIRADYGPTLGDLVAARRNLTAATEALQAAGTIDARSTQRVAEQDVHQLAHLAYAQGRLDPDQIRDITGLAPEDLRPLDVSSMTAADALRAKEIARQRLEHTLGPIAAVGPTPTTDERGAVPPRPTTDNTIGPGGHEPDVGHGV